MLCVVVCCSLSQIFVFLSFYHKESILVLQFRNTSEMIHHLGVSLNEQHTAGLLIYHDISQSSKHIYKYLPKSSPEI